MCIVKIKKTIAALTEFSSVKNIEQTSRLIIKHFLKSCGYNAKMLSLGNILKFCERKLRLPLVYSHAANNCKDLQADLIIY